MLPDHRTTPGHLAQVTDLEILAAAMRQELSTGPTGDIDGEICGPRNASLPTLPIGVSLVREGEGCDRVSSSSPPRLRL